MTRQRSALPSVVVAAEGIASTRLEDEHTQRDEDYVDSEGTDCQCRSNCNAQDEVEWGELRQYSSARPYRYPGQRLGPFWEG